VYTSGGSWFTADAAGFSKGREPGYRPGDVVRSRRSEALAWSHGNHRHDAHRIQEQRDGKAVDGMQKVSDEQYLAGSSAE
jgi:hypothetical protein